MRVVERTACTSPVGICVSHQTTSATGVVAGFPGEEAAGRKRPTLQQRLSRDVSRGGDNDQRRLPLPNHNQMDDKFNTDDDGLCSQGVS